MAGIRLLVDRDRARSAVSYVRLHATTPLITITETLRVTAKMPRTVSYFFSMTIH